MSKRKLKSKKRVMPRRKKDPKKKSRKQQRKKEDDGIVFTQFPNPFEGMPKEKVSEVYKLASQDFEQSYLSSLSHLEKLMASTDPLHLLSVLSVFGLSTGLSDVGHRSRKDGDALLTQAHVELAQALCLRARLSDKQYEPTASHEIQEAIDQLKKVSSAFGLKRLGEFADEHSEAEKSKRVLQERVRLHTQMVRNWGYYTFVVRTVRDLYGALDDVFIGAIGMRASDLVNAFESLVSDTEKGLTAFYKRLRPALQARSIEGCVRKYYDAMRDLEDSPEDLMQFIRTNEIPLESVKILLINHSVLRCPEIFTFSGSELAARVGVGADQLVPVLSKLSLCFGDLAGNDSEFLFMDNPVWEKPVIQLAADVFFCAMPQLFFSFSIQILEGLIRGVPRFHELCANRRAEFLEQTVEDTITRGLGKCKSVRNVVWSEGDSRYETDLLVQIDSYLMIVEAKSGTVSPPALRGAPDRLQRHIDELLVKPAQQSFRLALKVEGHIAGTETDDTFLTEFPFDISSIRQVIRLSVTLEDMATVQANMVDLARAGWIQRDLSFAPTMCLADLFTVFDILSSIPQRLHYLVRRAELEHDLWYVGDEIDLLGLYLDCGFNMAEAESPKIRLMLSGLSDPVDEYYVALDHGIVRQKPRLKSTQWWRDIAYFIEKRCPHRWSELAVMLLNVAPKDQVKLERQFKRLERGVRKNSKKLNQIDSLVLEPSKRRSDAVVLHAYRERDSDDRHRRMQTVAGRTLAKAHIKKCLVVGVNVDRGSYPYSTIMVFDRPQEERGANAGD